MKPNIHKSKAIELIKNKNAMLIDVRGPVEFRNGTINDATNISLRNISSLLTEDKRTPLIFFGESDDSVDIKQSIKYAENMKFKNIYSLGSIDNWK